MPGVAEGWYAGAAPRIGSKSDEIPGEGASGASTP